MSTFSRNQQAPRYPTYSERGYRPEPNPLGPPDMWPSGGGPGYSVYASAHGRNLAGVDDMDAEGIETYPNELDVLSQADDVRGNGVFDPNGSHGNIHPDEGIFQDHQSIPGYMDRDQFYTPSEVFDIPGGGNVMYVPGGATSFQQGQPETLRKQRLLWELPPSVRPFEPEAIEQQSTVNAPVTEEAIGTLDGVDKKKVGMAVAAGLGIGLGIVLWRMRK